MKKILLYIIPLFIFLRLAFNVYAYDLEVQCGSEKCAVSSNAPIFPPDTQWTPGKNVEKSIIIKNTSGGTKDILFKLKTSGQARDLDKFMNINLGSIWSGSLADLINEGEVSIISLPGGGKFEFIIAAQMDSIAPNNIQGKSSVFDFGFGFEGESGSNGPSGNNNSNNNNSSNNSSNNNNSGNSGSNNNPDNNNNETTSQFFAGDILGALTGLLGGEETEEGEPLGIARAIENEEEVLGITTATTGAARECRDNKVWILAILAQILGALIYFFKKKASRKLIALPVGLFSVSAAVILLIGCYLWPLVLAGAIFAISLLKYFKKLPLINRSK